MVTTSTLLKDKQTNFILTYNKHNYLKNKSSILIKDKLELKIYILLLGQNVSIDTSTLPKNISIKEFNKNNYRKIIQSINLPLLNNNKVLNCLEKIRPNPINFNHAVNINKKLTHKRDKRNMLIHKRIKLPHSNLFFYLTNLTTTPEINLDHIHNDHIEGTIISEACRQASMATAITNSKKNSQFYICTEYKRYHKLVRRNEPSIINVAEINKSKHLGVSYFTLFQNNHLCTSGYLIGYKLGGNIK